MATTDLAFSRQKDRNGKDIWVAETTVNGDYGIHVERRERGTFRVMQRFTDGGEYAVSNAPYSLTDVRRVIEVFMQHGIYPLHIRLVSYTEVTSAAIREAE